jgi:hypothetical protein
LISGNPVKSYHDERRPLLQRLWAEAAREFYRIAVNVISGSPPHDVVRRAEFHHGIEIRTDAIAVHSSAFDYDVLQMLKFMMIARQIAPWIIIIILLDKNEKELIDTLPPKIVDRISHYFQTEVTESPVDRLKSYLRTNYNAINASIIKARRQYFGDDVLKIYKDGPSAERYVKERERELRQSSYDFSISFSGKQRGIARDIANNLKGRNCKVFLDEFETARILGTNLTDFLYNVYAKETEYCVVLVSQNYVDGLWTTHERRAALDRAISSPRSAYILPVKIDDAELPGMPTSTAYVRWNNNPTEIATILFTKQVIDLAMKPPPEQLVSSDIAYTRYN